jgi:hypothetical protein
LYDPFSDLDKKAPEAKDKQWLIESYGDHYKDRRIDERHSNHEASNFQMWAKFCWDCAANIHTIGGEKHKNDDLKEKIQKKIWDPLSDKITPGPDDKTKEDPKFFFLGFGLDPQNTELIGFYDFISNAAKKKGSLAHHRITDTYWTNYNNSNALRQKFLSATQFNYDLRFFSQIEPQNSSTRTVYEALTYDFSFL